MSSPLLDISRPGDVKARAAKCRRPLTSSRHRTTDFFSRKLVRITFTIATLFWRLVMPLPSRCHSVYYLIRCHTTSESPANERFQMPVTEHKQDMEWLYTVTPKTGTFIRQTKLHQHHLPPWIRSFDLLRHRRVAIVSWGVHDLSFLEVCSWGRDSGVWCCPFFQGGWSSFVCI